MGLELVLIPSDVSDVCIRGLSEKNPLHVDIILNTGTKISDYRPQTINAVLNNAEMEMLVCVINNDAYLTVAGPDSPHELEIR